MKYLLIFICLVCCAERSFSQKTYNRWFFGAKSGMNFNTDPPSALTNPLIDATYPPFYTSTICDKNGDLLFYTDGLNVWNRFDENLPKTQNRWPWFLIDNVMPLICPYPGSDTLFYIFSVGNGRGNNPNYGNLVSMTINTAANLNTAAIVYPTPVTATNYYQVHTSNSAFMLAGIAHCNTKDTWISTVANNAVECFLVTETGVAAQPVRTPLPAGITTAMLAGGYSNMRFSANGEKLAIPVGGQHKIILYDFNNLTGVCSNARVINIPPPENLTDLELSAGGTKLYYNAFTPDMDGPDPTGIELHFLYQLDLEAGNATAIENSRYALNSFPDRGGCTPRGICFTLNRTLNLGPDGKIYVSLRALSTTNLDRTVNAIEFPDKPKDQCGYRPNYVNLGTQYRFINVNYIKSGSFSLQENGIQVKKKTCLGLPTEFALLFTQVDSVKWDFGDPGSGAGNFSTAAAPTHSYTAAGDYIVKAVVFKKCISDTSVTTVTIKPDPIVHIPDFIKDTVGCIGTSLYIDAKHAAATSYLWNDGLIYSYRTIDQPGQFEVRAFNDCSQDRRNFTVDFKECPCEVFVPSAFTPNNDGKNDEFRPFTTCAAKDYRFQVFNKYGNVVFSSSEVGKGWNGKFKTIELTSDVFVWQLQYQNPNTKALERRSGTVTLIR